MFVLVILGQQAAGFSMRKKTLTEVIYYPGASSVLCLAKYELLSVSDFETHLI